MGDAVVKFRSLLCQILICLVWLPAALAQTPAAGTLLIASHDLDDTFFAHSVVFLTHSGEDGAYGVIINRPVKMPLKEFLPLSPEADPHALYLGGPLHGKYVFVLARRPSPQLREVVKGVFFGAGEENVMRILESMTTAEVHAYAGFASWGPGQLEREIAEGGWWLAPGDADSVFGARPAELWRMLVKKWAGHWL